MLHKRVDEALPNRAPYLIVISRFSHWLRTGVGESRNVLKKHAGCVKIRDPLATEIAAHFVDLPLTHETRIHKRGVQTWSIGALRQGEGHSGVYASRQTQFHIASGDYML